MASSSGPLNEELQCSICLDGSYCRTHLEPHHRVPHLKKHTYISQKHQGPLELFRRDDQTYNNVPIEGESQENQLVLTQTDVQQTIQNRMKKIQDSQQLVKRNSPSSNDFSSRTVQTSTWMIIGLGFGVLFLLSKQYMSVSTQTEELQQEFTKLKRNMHLLLQTEDLIKEQHQEITKLKRNMHLLLQTEDLIKEQQQEITKLKRNMHLLLQTEDLKQKITKLKRNMHQMYSSTERLIKNGLKWAQMFAVDVTLDPETAHPFLILSDDGKQVSDGDIKQNAPENPKRFDYTVSVLAKQGFSSGRFYYEVHVKGKTGWSLGVARESINRKRQIILSPENGFWTVWLRNENQYKALDSSRVSLSLKVKPEIVGVFVDYEKGLVSFYDVGSRSHIYSFTGQTFTDKLYPFFSPCYDDGGKNSKPLIITPVNK